MLGSIYVGLSGMNAFSRGLQTISNNVANMNSLGFKTTSVNFSDVFNVGGLGSSYSGQGSRASGAGVQFKPMGLNFTQGDMRSTGGDLDLAIQGSGFLVLGGGADKTFYARTAQFTVDKDGYIVTLGKDAHRLNIFDASHRPTHVNVDLKRTKPPVATTKVTLDGFVGALGVNGVSTAPVTVYDSLGKAHSWTVTVTKGTETDAKWKVSVKNALNETIGEAQEIDFISSIPFGADPLDFTYTDSDGGSATVQVDWSSLENLSGPGISAVADGEAMGTLTGVTVNEEGQVELAYSNGDTESLGAIVLADFRDPQTLEQIGNGLFRSTGVEPRLGESDKDGLGKLVSGQVEASNVDLSQQFGDLILIQRGFQASSQVVSVSNDMIQQLFGIRGQG